MGSTFECRRLQEGVSSVRCIQKAKVRAAQTIAAGNSYSWEDVTKIQLLYLICRPFDNLIMAKLEQKYLVDKEVLEHLIAMLRDGLAKGVNENEIRDQVWEILDPEYRAKTDQAFKEMKDGKIKRFKNAEEMIKDLKSR